MKLALFIQTHLEDILQEWESFARTLAPAATQMSGLALRDHAKQILLAMAMDIETVETPAEQYDKSRGLAAAPAALESAASTHGTLRQISGFSLLQLTAEYRALRATVLRLWLPKVKGVTDASTQDMMRFNETIDQALAESVVTFSDQATRTRDMFLAILGHDLRSPLATISMAGHFLTKEGKDGSAKIGARVSRSAATMTSMVNDLLEYARTQLGGEMPIVLYKTDLLEICQAALDDASAAHPGCAFQIGIEEDLVACFDGNRLQQVFSNLLNNAAQHTDRQHPISICARAEHDDLVIQVSNRGPVIAPESLQTIFDPLIQLSVEGQQHGRPSTSLGLGLFIAREITLAHGGSISVESAELSGTVFTVRLPRNLAPTAPAPVPV